MYFIPAPNDPAQRGPPVRQLYRSVADGVYRPYTPGGADSFYGATFGPQATNGPSTRPRQEGLVQTVEDVIARGYLVVRHSEPAGAILSDRRDTAWLGLDDAISQIRARYEIYEQNKRDILYATASATNALHTWKAERGWPSDRQLDNLQRSLQNLYAQEREERVTLWRDVARIRAELPEAAQTYLTAHRKLQLLDTGGGEGPC
ncbi:MAG TPA: hypothetical protein PKK06_05630 [Phycisphaerae bacterium]|nr:hypothetical protein [Phycisphaerae bacterium]HNU44761.1 hypothetical protein [Phycisphaerae bacterium]